MYLWIIYVYASVCVCVKRVMKIYIKYVDLHIHVFNLASLLLLSINMNFNPNYPTLHPLINLWMKLGINYCRINHMYWKKNVTWIIQCQYMILLSVEKIISIDLLVCWWFTSKELQVKGYKITYGKKPSIAKSADFINISSAAGTTG